MKYLSLKISANALVKKGAVREKAIYKSNEKSLKLLNIQKDDLKHELHSIWYMLNKADAHGDYVDSQDVLDSACLDFMQNGNKQIKLTHNGTEQEAFVKELYIVPANHPIWKDAKYIGSIAGVIKFQDIELYEICKNEEWETSIEGVAMTDEIEKSEAEQQKGFFTVIKNFFLKTEPEKETTPEVIEKSLPEEIKLYIDGEIEKMKASLLAEMKTSTETEIEAVKKTADAKIATLKKEHEAESKEIRKEIGKSSQVIYSNELKKGRTIFD
jgi:hypothetical protein